MSDDLKHVKGTRRRFLTKVIAGSALLLAPASAIIDAAGQDQDGKGKGKAKGDGKGKGKAKGKGKGKGKAKGKADE